LARGVEVALRVAEAGVEALKGCTKAAGYSGGVGTAVALGGYEVVEEAERAAAAAAASAEGVMEVVMMAVASSVAAHWAEVVLVCATLAAEARSSCT